MRKTQKKEAEDFVGLLAQAHEAIRKAVEAGKNYIAVDLLEQCQNGAIRLGDLVERAEGEDCGIIPLLEDYCELIYQIYEGVRQGQTDNMDRISGNLHRFLVQIQGCLHNNITTRTEAVFLPYKASMWDSLESVWKAAEEDPDCDVYVIPIPYYDKNPDGSFRGVHYEGDLYPDYVPVTDYNDYDFAARRPDMIFIHNPYDEYNHVTSVHPFFYSKNLKQYTDKLIYIPYFVLEETDLDDEEAVEDIQHFCLVPGVFYADKVVVQSENMRQIYIRTLAKEFNDYSMEVRKYWENKILGIGSPKFDKVAETEKKEIQIPEEWLEIIRKPDGGRKKVILYNTGIVGLLAHNEKMLVKLEDVFHVFREKRYETALLWRPHPLIESTLASMRPQLLETYCAIRHRYLEEGWGIYDDTADLERAITLSDAYYGDASSVVQLYEKTGKPIMIQNAERIYTLHEG